MSSSVTQNESDLNQPKRKFGAITQGLFGIAGITALVKGATYFNDKEEVCPWNPALLTFLLTYGIANVAFQLFYITLICFAFYKKSKGDTSIFRFTIYAPAVSGVINGGIVIWGLVLLYSKSDGVTFTQHALGSNEHYCETSVYVVSMIASWWYVTVLLVTIVFYGIQFIRSRNSSNNLA